MSASLLRRLGGIKALAELGSRGQGKLVGVPAGAASLVLWWLHQTTRRSVVALTVEAETLYTDIGVWGSPGGICLFPAADTPPFDRVPPSEEVTRRRLATLAMLAGGKPALVVVSPQGLARPTLSPRAMLGGISRLRRGERVEREALLRRLIELGYRRVAAVSAPGDFAVRGGILDVFSLDSPKPWRAEWFGNEVEDLRVFEVDTQTSVVKPDAVGITPARELDLGGESVAHAIECVTSLDRAACRQEVRETWQRDIDRLGAGAYDEGVDVFFPYLLGEEPASLFDHLPKDALVVCVGGRERILRAAESHIQEVEGLRDQEAARGELPPAARSGLFDVAVVRRMLATRACVEIIRESATADGVELDWCGIEAFAGRFDSFCQWVGDRQAEGSAVVIASRQQQRVEELAAEHGMVATDIVDFGADTGIPDASLSVVPADLSAGFSIPEALVAVVTDHEVFGVTKHRGSPLARGARRAFTTSARGARRAASGRAAAQAFTLQFSPGDLVVHRDHGIARFVGMGTVRGDDFADHEYMTLEYADAARLFVPVEHLDRVDRYVGGADSSPPLSRLGGADWERTRRRVKERTEAVARDLLEIYSRREMAKGHAFDHDGVWQNELEASFPYEETADQELVIDEIKRDMESSKPMDRVVCGDVGFGKTELAVRAAFKAVVEGRQVAVLVPTTVLAQQHFDTFHERLAPFPVTVAQLSRFCSKDDIRVALSGLAAGTVDIVVGTHRLLQRDVRFRDLGLVIVDEEQRFGVMQKERFKELRAGVDVLSLSATPIPRTLHMSLAGIRDLSVIQSPPEDRQPIKTYVTAREDSLIREVISRELARGGQVFYVHNRVQTIEKEADVVRRLVPEGRVAVGHGRMEEGQLAAVMHRFTEGEVDILVATTIIESGLDIPNANTIIVNDAHRFGLAQLYQLRGRVGRSGNRAYAYLLYPGQRALTEKADKRLDVLAELQDLGAGFKLAMHDLEIRGAGNLLGEEQHGEISAVGLELYNHLLNQAVSALQGKPVVESPSQVSVSLPLATHLPPGYVAEERLRLRCYQELAACVSERELEHCVKGLIDRFGSLPVPALGLIFSLRVRLLAAAGSAQSVESQGGGVVIQMPIDHGLDLDSVTRQFGQWLTASATRLRLVPAHGEGWQDPGWQDVLIGLLRELGRLTRVRQHSGVSV